MTRKSLIKIILKFKTTMPRKLKLVQLTASSSHAPAKNYSEKISSTTTAKSNTSNFTNNKNNKKYIFVSFTNDWWYTFFGQNCMVMKLSETFTLIFSIQRVVGNVKNSKYSHSEKKKKKWKQKKMSVFVTSWGQTIFFCSLNKNFVPKKCQNCSIKKKNYGP